MSTQPRSNLQKFGDVLRFKLDPYIISLSDTIAVSVPVPKTESADSENEEMKKAFSIEAACLITVKILDLFIRDEPALTLRGCISYGEHLVRDNFIVGPAVDEAAEQQDLAEGAFVWLYPDAAQKYENLLKWRREMLSQFNEKLKDLGGDEYSQASNFLLLIDLPPKNRTVLK